MRTWMQDWLDEIALGASWLCLAHCLLLPLALALLPAFAGVLAVPEWFHLLILAVAVPISAAALLPQHPGHRDRVPPLLAMIGITALAGGLLLGSLPLAEVGLTVAGSLLLASAHVVNWRRRRLATAD